MRLDNIEDELYVLSQKLYHTSMQQYLKGKNMHDKISFFLKLLKLMKQLHDKKIYHLDLKPLNIFVENDEPILIDFGLTWFPEQAIHESVPCIDVLFDAQ
jgi:tRNA A-37 threonylcarbamoyl transferase component Bud32